MMGRLDGDIILLGVGGKIGPSLARMARRATDLAGVKRRIIGVSRFSESREEAALKSTRGRDDALRSARRCRGARPSLRAECDFHGRNEIRFDGK